MRVGRGLRLWATVVVIACVGVVSGCSDDEPVPEFDLGEPATLTPQDALLYGEFWMQPEGDARNGLNSLMAQFYGRTPISRLASDAMRRASEMLGLDDQLTYREDVAPWIGERAGIFAAGRAKSRAWAVILPVEDRTAAESTADRIAADARAPAADVDGIEYRLLNEDVGLAFLGDFLVFGDRRAVTASVQAHADVSLADSPAFKELLESEATGRSLAFGLLDSSAFIPDLPYGLASPTSLADTKPPTNPLLASATEAQLTARGSNGKDRSRRQTERSQFFISADREGARVELATRRAPPRGLIAAKALFDTLPGSAWLAYSEPDFQGVWVEAYRRGLLSGLQQAAPGLTPDEAMRRFEQLSGISVRTSLDAIRAGGLFVGKPGGLTGAIVLEFDDEKAGQDALGLARLSFLGGADVELQPLPPGRTDGTGFTVGGTAVGRPIWVIHDARRLVFALDPEGVRLALNREKTDDGSKSFPEPLATELGDGFQPIGYIDSAQLASGFGLTEPGLFPRTNYLEQLADEFERITIGTRVDHGVYRQRIVAATFAH